MIYTDEYSIVNCYYLVHAIPVNPEEDDEAEGWLIATILHVASQAIPTYMRYPTRALRDAAFEKLCALMQRRALAEEIEEDDGWKPRSSPA